MELPYEMLILIINSADLDVVNSFARSCLYLAEYVRKHAVRLADGHVRLSREISDDQIFADVLPNGTFHGDVYFTDVDIGEELVVEYTLGVANRWKHNNSEASCVVYGRVGSPYVVISYADSICRPMIGMHCGLFDERAMMVRFPIPRGERPGHLIDGGIGESVDAWGARMFDKEVRSEHPTYMPYQYVLRVCKNTRTYELLEATGAFTMR